MKKVGIGGLIAGTLLGALELVALAASDACTAGWDPPTVASGKMCRLLAQTNDLLRLEAGLIAYMSLALVFVAIGALVLLRADGHRIGLLLLGLGLVLVAAPAAQSYAQWALVASPGNLPGGVLAAWLANILGGPVLFALVAAFFLLFPTGRIPSPGWRPVAWLLIVAGAAAAAFPALVPGGMTAAPLVDNPLGVESLKPVFDFIGVPIFLTLLVVVLVAMASVAVRFRKSRGVERQQLKWVGASGVVLGLTLGASPLFFTRPVLNGLWMFVFPLAVSTIPISAGLAILRYRLYDIDVIVNRTLVYGALTAILAATYFGLVIALQKLLSPLTQQSDISIAASTLAVAGLFGPLRRWIQSFIDRRFYRSRYDAQKTLEAFSARLRDEVALEHLTFDLLRVVTETVRPRHASLWLRPGETR